MCRAAAQAAAQSELGQCPDMRTKRKATTVPRRNRRTGLFGAWLEPHPRGSVCRAAAQAAAQSELGQCPDLRTKRKATTVPRRSRHTGLFRAWLASHTPQGAQCVVSSCGRSHSSKPQLEVSLRRQSVPTSSCLRLVEGGTDRRGGRAACLASSLRPHCSPRELLPRDGQLHLTPSKTGLTAWRAVRCPSLLFSGPAGKKPSRVDRVYLSVPPLSTINLLL